MEKHLVEVVIEKDTDGYFSYCPSIQGCYSQGKSYEEALVNINDAIRLHVEDLLASGEKLKEIEPVNKANGPIN